MPRPEWELVFESRLSVTAVDVLPDVMRPWTPVESHMLAEGLEP